MSEQETVGFQELLSVLRVIDSRNKQTKLGKCIDYELEDLMQAINEYNKGGKLVVEINIGIEDKNELSFQAVVKTVKPKGKIPKNPLYMDRKGQLYLDDPDQLRLFSPSVVNMNNTNEKGAVND